MKTHKHILKIASRLSYRPNFANYPYREEMVSDAVLNCVEISVHDRIYLGGTETIQFKFRF